ncbi:MAG: hypothetical protein HC769_31405 [Cyanobacteria bacterium CRU_2_1]|nr:hypothetical protein [Cyanobacteria bacterium CRU_2_1]
MTIWTKTFQCDRGARPFTPTKWSFVTSNLRFEARFLEETLQHIRMIAFRQVPREASPWRTLRAIILWDAPC